MNLLERIEQVQYGRNELFTGVKEKQGLRDKLNDEVEAFLNRGGKVKEIPTGYSSYRDGKVPMRGITRGPKEKLVYDPSIQETPDEVIEARNKQIRGGKLSNLTNKVKTVKCSAETKAQIKFLKDLIKKFGEGDRDRLCKMVGISKQTFNNAACGDHALGSDSWNKLKSSLVDFKFTPKVKKPKYTKSTNPDHLRRQAIKEARLKANAEGKKDFMAECAHHGLTRYVFEGAHYGRCCECRKVQNLKHRTKRKTQNESKANA